VTRRARVAALLFGSLSALACRERSDSERSATGGLLSAAPVPTPAPPALLYLPDGGDHALEGERPPALLPPTPSGRCPPDMVDVSGRFCIDRYEASLVDARLGRPLSPYFSPRKSDAKRALEAFTGTAPQPGAPELPRPPVWELEESFEPKAAALPASIPNGYVSGLLARAACEQAGKRLCAAAEWVTACRGEQNRRFPYGEDYETGACNVYRDTHPARALWGDASKNHLDPRLNLVADASGPLLRRTGETERCRSQWGSDAAFDMVGNLDEWVDEPGGAFLGGFYARATANGCEARVTEHPVEYFDYSTGVRCCR
jgi:sulfatase modifying factor 1